MALCCQEDPASLLADQGPTLLRAVLHNAGSLAVILIDERIGNIDSLTEQLTETAQIIAAQPPSHWHKAIDTVADQLSVPAGTVQKAVLDAAGQWNDDRRRVSGNQIAKSSAVRARIETTATAKAADRWATLARSLDRRLVEQTDWPATAAMMQEIHDAGHDIPALTRRLVNNTPRGETPARDLRYLLVGYLPDQNGISYRASSEDRINGALEQRRMPAHISRRPDVGPRR